MTLMDLHMAAPTSNVDAAADYSLSRALEKPFAACKPSRGSRPTPVALAVNKLRGLSLPATLREFLAIACGREGATT
jgi:hypothetical protein